MVPPCGSRIGGGIDKRFLILTVAHVFKLHRVDQHIVLNTELLLQLQRGQLVTAAFSQRPDGILEKATHGDDQPDDRKREAQGSGQVE